jgi:TolB-like protein/class 3 adenylate cyclase/Flp pilus assembly protein TadD
MGDEASGTASTEHRRLAAIMFTDIVGFSRQMGTDEARMLRVLAVHNQVIAQAVTEHHGHVIKTMGDAFVVDFPSVVHAVQCAQHVQNRFRNHNAQTAKEEQIHVRIGIHLGDIIEQNGDVLGDGVNIASRLQTLTEPDTICISQAVYQEVEKKLPLGTVVSLGRPQLKNIVQRFPVYALLSEAPQGIWQRLQVQRLKLSHRVRPVHWAAMVGLLLIMATVVAVRYLSPLFPSTQPLAPSTQPLPLPDKPSIVVLPFVNMSNDPEQEYFSDGITEDITTGLAKISSLFVIARNSAFTYKGKAVKVQDVSREMGVQYVLEGSVRKADSQVRITVQLINGLTGSHLWAERFDRGLKDIFALQDEVTQKIVEALAVKLTEGEQGRLVRKGTNSVEAYDYYLRGLDYYWRFTKDANAQARQMFEKAIEVDPKYAAAYAALGWTYMREWIDQWSQGSQTLEQAFALAQRAIALDDTLPGAHNALSAVYLWKKQYEQAIVEAQQAIALDSNDADVYASLGLTLTCVGRPEEAVAVIEKAMRLNPHYPALYLFRLGLVYHLTGRYEEAITTLKRVLTRTPDFQHAHAFLAATYSELGREEEARVVAAEVLRVSPHFSLEVYSQRLPFKEPVVTRVIAALRKAGLR